MKEVRMQSRILIFWAICDVASTKTKNLELLSHFYRKGKTPAEIYIGTLLCWDVVQVAYLNSFNLARGYIYIAAHLKSRV